MAQATTVHARPGAAAPAALDGVPSRRRWGGTDEGRYDVAVTRRPTFVALGIRIAIASAIGLSLACGPASAPTPAARSTTVDGRPLDPLADASGPTVLVFVSTHCPISNRYAPTLRHLADAWRPRGISMWLVYPDPADDAAAIEAHLRAFALPDRALRDPQHDLVSRAGVRVTPEAAVFDPASPSPRWVGRIDDRVVEFGKVRATAEVAELANAVDAVADGRPAPPPGGDAIGCYISDLR